MRWTRRLAVSTGLAVAAVGIAVPLSLSSAPASAAGQPLGSLSSLAGLTAADPAAPHANRLPAALREALRAAWSQPDGQRVAALQGVLDRAVAGDFGTDVQRRAVRLQKRLAALDPGLRADLQKAIEQPKDQRRQAFRDIRRKLHDGGYGDHAKRGARLLRHLLRTQHAGR